MATGVSRKALGSVDAWRAEYLYKVGVPFEEAERIAPIRAGGLEQGYAIDVHYVEALIVGGASWQEAVNLASAI